ncbi:hypothetical protein ABK040_000045 [Willaertia magna]
MNNSFTISNNNNNNKEEEDSTKNSVVIIDIISKSNDVKRNSGVFNNVVADSSVVQEETKSTTSKISKVSKANSNISSSGQLLKIQTCCGVVELSPVKTASLVGMTVTIFAFLTLAAIIITAFVLQYRNDLNIIVDRGDIKNMRDTLTHTTLLAIYAPDNVTSSFYINFYNATFNSYIKTLTTLMVNFPEGFKTGWATGGNPNGTTVSKFEQKALTLVKQDKKKEALRLIYDFDYLYAFNNFTNNMDNVLDLLLQREVKNQSDMLAITLVGFIVILIAVIILLPIVIGIFVLAINRDQENIKKLKLANAVMLMDTMNNDKLREIFKKQCEEEHSMENYNFLEKVTLYKRLCEQSYEIQEKLYGTDSHNSESISNASEVTNSTSTNGNSNSAMKGANRKQERLEKELRNVEKKKYEMAFDIYTDFLDVNGGNAVNITKSFIEDVKVQLDYFNTGHNEILAEALFDSVGKEISIVMLDTHQRFKSSIAFQKQMKINNLVTKKKKHNH